MAALESRLKGAGLPPEASKVVLRDLARLKKMQPSQPEYTVRDVRPMFFPGETRCWVVVNIRQIYCKDTVKIDKGNDKGRGGGRGWRSKLSHHRG